MSRLVAPLSVIRRCDWLAVRAGILAADGRPDAEVMAVLDQAVKHGLMPKESEHSINTLGDETPQRFAQSSFAFAEMTERADAESARTGTPSQLEVLEERVDRNYENRWRLKAMYKAVGFCGFVGLLLVMFALIDRADAMHLNGKQCTSIRGVYLGLSGCRSGRYCADIHECVSCPAAPAAGDCDAVDGEDGCCTAAFLSNCPADPFNCTGR
jgi:hypothetical protein